MGSTSGTLDDIEGALEAAGGFLPQILGVVGAFYPPAKSLIAFLPLIQVALQGVQTVRAATGTTTAVSTGAVISHLTPGAPSAPALSGNVDPGDTQNPNN